MGKGKHNSHIFISGVPGFSILLFGVLRVSEDEDLF